MTWQGGKSLAWDVSVVSTLAQFYVDRCGAVAEMAAERKLAKYSNLASKFTFQPIVSLCGLTLILWKGEKPLTRDVTVVSTLADS